MDESRLVRLLTEFKDEIKKELEVKVDQIKDKLEENWNKTIEKIETCERKNAVLEREIRRNNLVVHGLEEIKNDTYFELEKQILNLVKEEVKVDIKEEEIDFVRRIGKRAEGKIRPVLFALTTYRKKVMILKNKKWKDKDVYISEDYPKEIIEKRKELKEQMLEERKKGKFAIIVYDKLIVREYSGKKKRRASSGTPQKERGGKQSAEKIKVKRVKDKEARGSKDLGFFFRDRTNSESSSSSVYSTKNTKTETK